MNTVRRTAAVVVLPAVLLLFGGCSPEGQRTLEGFCGAASKPAMQECARRFEEKTGVEVNLHFSGSGTMLSRLKMSGQGDFYIPGSPDYMKKARQDGVVFPGTIRKIAYLVPSILVPEDNPKGVDGLDDLDAEGMEVGIGNPTAVCVGLYAVEVLDKNNILSGVRDHVKTQARSCSATAALVAMDKVDAILGWRVFGEWKPDKIDIVPIEPDRIPRLAYIPAAVSTHAGNRKLAEQFIDFLKSSRARAIFSEWGYIPSQKKARKYARDADIGGTYELPPGFNSGG